jgi:hypothetical protein
MCTNCCTNLEQLDECAIWRQGTELGAVRLGPWKIKNMYESQSLIDQRPGVYNVPVRKNESAIDSIVPWDGFCFQITTAGERHGINRAGFDKLIKSKALDRFINGGKNNAKRDLKFVWIVEGKDYDTFTRQNFLNSNN